jgi:hypothetical protein
MYHIPSHAFSALWTLATVAQEPDLDYMDELLSS